MACLECSEPIPKEVLPEQAGACTTTTTAVTDAGGGAEGCSEDREASGEPAREYDPEEEGQGGGDPRAVEEGPVVAEEGLPAVVEDAADDPVWLRQR